jgi:hypothetical protein
MFISKFYWNRIPFICLHIVSMAELKNSYRDHILGKAKIFNAPLQRKFTSLGPTRSRDLAPACFFIPLSFYFTHFAPSEFSVLQTYQAISTKLISTSHSSILPYSILFLVFLIVYNCIIYLVVY